MKALRLGSYSIARTVPGMPILSRRKSIWRYFFLCPPPLRRTLILPPAPRPACLFLPFVRAFSGSLFVISSKVRPVLNRRPGVSGLYFLIPMRCVLPFPYAPSNMAIFSSGGSVMMAFFHDEV